MSIKAKYLFILILVLGISFPSYAFLRERFQTFNAIGTIQVAFTPGSDADKLIIQTIQSAHKTIYVQAFSFTHKEIAQSLIQARKRGVDVRVIADSEQHEKIPTSQVMEIARNGVPVFLDSEHQSAHNKLMIIDSQTVITGSYNFTHSAQYKNAENVLVLQGNAPLASAYTENWQRHFAHTTPLRP